MKHAKLALLVILVLMSLVAGAAKLMQMPQELKFFEEAKLGLGWMVVLGVFQVFGGALGAIPITRKSGLIFMALGFGVSTLVILMTGDIGFALVSLLPVALCIYLILQERKKIPS
jgi:hypothetical protein